MRFVRGSDPGDAQAADAMVPIFSKTYQRPRARPQSCPGGMRAGLEIFARPNCFLEVSCQCHLISGVLTGGDIVTYMLL